MPRDQSREKPKSLFLKASVRGNRSDHPGGAALREAGILPFRDGRGESLSPTWSGTRQRETRVPSTPEADLEEDGFPLLSRSGPGWGEARFPPSQAGVARCPAAAHAREPRVRDGAAPPGCGPHDGPGRGLGSRAELAARGAEGSQDRGPLPGSAGTVRPGTMRPPPAPRGRRPSGGRVPRPQRHAGPLTTVAGSRLVEVGVALYAEAELGVALAPRALGAQDAAAVALRLGHFVQGLVGEGQRRGQGQRQGQQRWTPTQPQGRWGQPHPRGRSTLCRCRWPSPRDACPKGSPEKRELAEPGRGAGARSRQPGDRAGLGLAAAELRRAELS